MAKDTARLGRRAEFLNLLWRLRFGRGDPIDATRKLSGFVRRYGNEYSARATAALSNALVRGTPLAREGAAEALGWVGERAAAEPLITATKDAMPPVRAAALEALSRLDRRAFTAVFQRSVPDPDPRVRSAALNGLVAAGDPRYAALGANLPRTECLADVVARLLPYWQEAIVPDLRSGATVLLAAHGNSLRALVKHLDGVSDTAIAGLNIPTGVPLRYDLDDDLRPTNPGGTYLDPDAAEASIAAVANQGR